MTKKQRPSFGTLRLRQNGSIYLAAAEPVTCKIIWVPLSNFTLRLAELITEPCALPAAEVFNAKPCIPTTPRVAELRVPFAAAPAVWLTEPFTAPVAEFVTEPAVLPAALVAEPSVEFAAPPPTPPIGVRPPPPARPPPMEPPLPLPIPDPRLLVSSPLAAKVPWTGGARA